MILEPKRFYTIKTSKRKIVLWVDKKKVLPDFIEVEDSTLEEKEFWVDSMSIVDRMEKNDFMGVTLNYWFDKWKNEKKQKINK